MKLESDCEFHQLAMEAILAMCTNKINGKQVLKVEGYLSLTVESGEIFCVVIKETLDEADVEDNGQSWAQMPSTEGHYETEDNETKDEAVLQQQIFYNDLLQETEKLEIKAGSESQLFGCNIVTEGEQRSDERSCFCPCCEKSFKTLQGIEQQMKVKYTANNCVCPDGCSSNMSENDLLSRLQASTLYCFGDAKVQPEFFDADFMQKQSYLGDNGNSSKVLEICPTEMWEELREKNKAQVLVSCENVDLQSEVLPLKDKIVSESILKEKMSEDFANESYKCPDCKESFKTNFAFAKHVSIKHGYCVVSKTNSGAMQSHRCEMCKKGFLTSEQLFRHCQRSHKIKRCNQTGQPMYKCFCCGKVYPTYSELRRHRSLYHRVKPFTCRDCNISFNSQGDQIYHRMRYHRKRTCNQCQLICLGLISFTEHVRSCHPGIPVYKVNKQLVCEFCSGTFADEKHLNDHIQSKHLGFVHTCEVCGKVLGTAETLRIHRKLHKAETYRTCDVCGKQFGRLAGLMEHMRSKHPENVPEKYRCSFRCHHCGLIFSRRHTLHRHTENKHDGKTFICDICGKVFRSKRYIARHKKMHHAGVNMTEQASNSIAHATKNLNTAEVNG